MNTLPAKLCDVCIKPGHCCSGFRLSNPDTNESFMSLYVEQSAGIVALIELVKRDLPFIVDQPQEWPDDGKGRPFIHWSAKCIELTPQGRCGIYETRPQLCRDYKAAQDALCIYGKMQNESIQSAAVGVDAAQGQI